MDIQDLAVATDDFAPDRLPECGRRRHAASIQPPDRLWRLGVICRPTLVEPDGPATSGAQPCQGFESERSTSQQCVSEVRRVKNSLFHCCTFRVSKVAEGELNYLG